MYRYISVLLLVLSLTPATFSQTNKKLKELFEEAYEYILAEDYSEALPLLNEISKEVQTARLYYYTGICYLHTPGQKALAIAPLVSACESLSTGAGILDVFANNAPPDALFQLGEAYRINNRLDDAIASYRKLLQLTDPADATTQNIIHQRIESCKRAKTARIQKAPVVFEVPTCQTGRYALFNPVASPDGRRLVYMGRLKFYDAPLQATFSDTCTIDNLSPEIRSDGDFYLAGAGDSCQVLYFEQSSIFSNGNLYESRLQNQRWSKATALPDGVNSPFREASCSRSADGTKLYFSSNRPGGYGGLDLYVSQILDDNNYGPPVNLGEIVNSLSNEIFAYETADGSKIFFASDGHNTMGGYDIFVSTKTNDGKWGQPEPLPYPVNTTDDDGYFFPLGDGSAGLLAADPESTGQTRIYKVSGYFDKVPPLPLADTSHMATPVLVVAPEQPGDQGSDTIFLGPVYFAFGSALLNQQQKGEISILARQMAEHNIEFLEITGYTDSIGDEVYNQWLALQRANSVAAVLQPLLTGCRVEIISKGETENMAINTPEGRKYNRRVVIRIKSSLPGLTVIDTTTLPEHLSIKGK